MEAIFGHTELPTMGAMDNVAARRRQLAQTHAALAARRQQAVCVRGACKQFGSKTSPNIILKGLNMTVPKGAIYGLLGASGCGKTTLLSCIVGRRRLNSGDIWVLGGRPGSRGSGIPGPRVGYMPQELALYGEFSVRETLIYFGWIAGMSTAQVERRLDFLVKLLQIPKVSKYIKNLSGGQQRRISLAVVLLHDPELLILDEPTVGVDPLLRRNIWEHLVKIASTGTRTIIITTHYIEETRQANMIGLMRGGQFLAEESPDSLMRRYNCENLEEVFLKLSVLQNRGSIRTPTNGIQIVKERRTATSMTNNGFDHSTFDEERMAREIDTWMATQTMDLPLSMLPPDDLPVVTLYERLSIFQSNHMKAQIWKNFVWMWRNLGMLAFIVGLPCVQVILFCLAIGQDPVGLRLCVVNQELANPSHQTRSISKSCPIATGCSSTLLSCRYLRILDTKSVKYDLYGSEEAANQEVLRGRAWGSLVIKKYFSNSLAARTKTNSSTSTFWNSSDIEVRLDMSNQQIGSLLYRDIQYAYFDLVEELLIACKVNPSLGRLPLRFEQPIYGDTIQNSKFTDFAAPGVLLTITFFLAVALTSGAMLIERNEGILERCLVSGVTEVEMLFSHVSTQFMITCFQASLLMFFGFVVFDLVLIGPMVWAILLTFLTALCGMCFGFVISAACDSERTALYLAMGSFLPIVMLCGIMWPIEGMNSVLRVVALFLPLTMATQSLRSITLRGWSIDEPVVYAGFVAIVCWVFVFLIVSILLLKFKKG